MPFDDNDLKRLKGILSECPINWKKAHSKEKILALLARLEESELAHLRILELAVKYRMYWSDFDGRVLLRQVQSLQEAWRKSKGEGR